MFEETITQVAHLDDISKVVIIDVHEPVVVISASATAAVTTATTTATTATATDDAATGDDATDDATTDDDATYSNNTSIEIVYETSVVVGEGNDYEDSDGAYEETSKLLESSIASGEFTEVLDEYAVEEGSEALSHASASTLAEVGPSTTTITVIDDDDVVSDSSSNSYNEPIITGIIVAGVCVVVAITGYLFYRWRKRVHSYNIGKNTWVHRPSVDIRTKQNEEQMGLGSSLDQSLI